MKEVYEEEEERVTVFYVWFWGVSSTYLFFCQFLESRLPLPHALSAQSFAIPFQADTVK